MKTAMGEAIGRISFQPVTRAFVAALSQSRMAELVTADLGLKPLERTIRISRLTT